MITPQEYKNRRKELMRRLSSDAVAILPAAAEKIRNGDAHYRFRQDSDFYYLTGFLEPDALLVMTSGRSVLFHLPRDPLQEQWTGKRLGPEDACSVLGVDDAFSSMEIDKKIPELLENKKTIYYVMGRYPAWEERIQTAWQRVKGLTRRGVAAPDVFCDLAPLLGEMRLFKSADEMNLMRRAAEISVGGHHRAMSTCRQATHEYQVEAELLYEFTRQGSRNVAYDSIVAGGAHACILHYTENNQLLNPGDLLLVDAGAEYENYASDITRTYPLNGRFTPEQRSIYDLVLHAQQRGMSKIKPGCLWNEIQTTVLEILTQGLVELGLLSGSVSELLERGSYRPFYMHNSGHWLGLDVHDTGAYKIGEKWRPLEPGMVLTVEPGLYITPGTPNVDPRWYGIGVRIEDDVHVTPEGYENLTAGLPIEATELEAIVRGG
jgi:Xaa-Pro aminopeptidase